MNDNEITLKPGQKLAVTCSATANEDPVAPTPEGRSLRQKLRDRMRRSDWMTLLAIAVAAALLMGIFLAVALLRPPASIILVGAGVLMKGVASLLQALMKTEDDETWRKGPKKAAAWFDCIAVILAFPGLMAGAIEAGLL